MHLFVCRIARVYENSKVLNNFFSEIFQLVGFNQRILGGDPEYVLDTKKIKNFQKCPTGGDQNKCFLVFRLFSCLVLKR